MDNDNQVQQETKNKRVEVVLTGVVMSTKANKTASVSVERIIQHPVYKKIVRQKKKYLVHDEENRCKTGDTVQIKLVRPISKLKRWLLVDVLSTAPAKTKDVEVPQ